jgi:hypothetical protein
MPLKIVHKNHVDIPGRGYVLLTTPHAISPEADLFMGQIVEEAALLSKCFAVIGKAGREFGDPSTIQVAQSDLRESIQRFLKEDGLRCILDIRGKMEPGVCISSAGGESASQSTTDMIKTRLAGDFRLDAKAEDKDCDPYSLATSFSKKGPDGSFILEAIQVEIGLEEKTLKREKIIGFLADIVGLINQNLGYSESDQGAGNILD